MSPDTHSWAPKAPARAETSCRPCRGLYCRAQRQASWTALSQRLESAKLRLSPAFLKAASLPVRARWQASAAVGRVVRPCRLPTALEVFLEAFHWSRNSTRSCSKFQSTAGSCAIAATSHEAAGVPRQGVDWYATTPASVHLKTRCTGCPPASCSASTNDTRSMAIFPSASIRDTGKAMAIPASGMLDVSASCCQEMPPISRVLMRVS